MNRCPRPDDTNAHWLDEVVVARVLSGEDPGRRPSWRELLAIVERAAQLQVPFEVVCRRVGLDNAQVYRALAKHTRAPAA